MFWIDIIFNFFIAYEKDDLAIEHDLKVVCANYLGGWFIIDLMAVLPVDQILQTL